MIFRKWEVYRVIPQRWKDEIPQSQWMWSDSPYSRHWTEKAAKRMAADCDWGIRNGRSDEDFAAFKVRRVT